MSPKAQSNEKEQKQKSDRPLGGLLTFIIDPNSPDSPQVIIGRNDAQVRNKAHPLGTYGFLPLCCSFLAVCSSVYLGAFRCTEYSVAEPLDPPICIKVTPR